MIQVSKASAEWKALINKENLFLIIFGFHLRKMHGKVPAEAFVKKVREELAAWTRLVRRVSSSPAEARSLIPASRRMHSPMTEKRDPSLPAIATLPLATTPAPMDVAGPSNNRRQVSRQEADDRRMAENLEAALHEDEPMSFGELN